MIEIHCKRATELISDSMNRRLTRTERFRLALHLMICKACRAYRRQVRLISEALQRDELSADEIAVAGEGELSNDARQRIDEALCRRDR